MNILENCNFSYEVLNELFGFGGKKEVLPDKAIEHAISKLKSFISVNEMLRKATKIDKNIEGSKKYKDFVEGDLKKLAIAKIDFKVMIKEGIDPNTYMDVEDANDCKRVINNFANQYLFNRYCNINSDGYHASLGSDKNFAYIYLCKGAVED